METFHTGVSEGICIRPAENMNELPDEYFLEDWILLGTSKIEYPTGLKYTQSLI